MVSSGTLLTQVSRRSKHVNAKQHPTDCALIDIARGLYLKHQPDRYRSANGDHGWIGYWNGTTMETVYKVTVTYTKAFDDHAISSDGTDAGHMSFNAQRLYNSLLALGIKL